MRDHRVMPRAELAGDARCLGLGLNARELDSLVDVDEFDTVELAQEIHMPPGPPEFAVGDRLEADLLLLGDDLADFFVFDGGEAIGGNGAGMMLGAGFLEAGGPQQGTDMIGAEGRLRPRHRFLPEVAEQAACDGAVYEISCRGSSRIAGRCVVFSSDLPAALVRTLPASPDDRPPAGGHRGVRGVRETAHEQPVELRVVHGRLRCRVPRLRS